MPCCPIMSAQLEYDCPQHGNDCPDLVVRRGREGRLFLIAPNASYELIFCPWCGTKLQEPEDEIPAEEIVPLAKSEYILTRASDEEIDKLLTDAGCDPVVIGKRGEEAVKALLKGDDP